MGIGESTKASLSKRPLWLSAMGLLAVLLFAYGVYLALVVSPPDHQQGQLIRIMYAHVSVAWVMFVAVTLMAVFGMLFLWRGSAKHDVWATANAELALFFSALTLIGGMIYARPTLNVFWTWDAKLTLTALIFVLLAGYFIVRNLVDDPQRRGRVSAVIGIIVLVSLPFNWMAAEWFRTLHPAKSFAVTGSGVTDHADPIFRMILLYNFIVAGVIYTYFMLERVRIGKVEAALADEAAVPVVKGETVRV